MPSTKMKIRNPPVEPTSRRLRLELPLRKHCATLMLHRPCRLPARDEDVQSRPAILHPLRSIPCRFNVATVEGLETDTLCFGMLPLSNVLEACESVVLGYRQRTLDGRPGRRYLQ